MQASRPRILIADDDRDIREALCEILSDEGYETVEVGSAAAALDALDTQVFQAVVTDVFAGPREARLAQVDAIARRARPIPVGVISGWQVADEEVREHGLRFAMQKPFDISEFLVALAQMRGEPLDPQKNDAAARAIRYFEALENKDWDGLVALCSEDVRFEGPRSQEVELRGRDAFRRHAVETFTRFREARFKDFTCYATPGGIAVRYLGSWIRSGGRVYLAGTALLRIEGGLIVRIGVVLNQTLLDRLAPD